MLLYQDSLTRKSRARKKRYKASFNKKIKLDPDTLEAISQQSTKPEDVKGKSIQDLLSMTRYGESGKKYDDEQAVLDQFFEFISSFPNPLLVAQNASFDMKFVKTIYIYIC